MPHDAQRKNGNGANLGFEEKLWKAADTLRGQVDAAEYKHVVLGLIFLKYISDAFAERHAALQRAQQTLWADPEDPDEYTAVGIFWVPPAARWADLQARAKLREIVGSDGRRRTIGGVIDDAMDAIEKVNPALKNVLPKDYARAAVRGALRGGGAAGGADPRKSEGAGVWSVAKSFSAGMLCGVCSSEA